MPGRFIKRPTNRTRFQLNNFHELHFFWSDNGGEGFIIVFKSCDLPERNQRCGKREERLLRISPLSGTEAKTASMCGIAGMMGSIADHRAVQRMEAALFHRGPDSGGFFPQRRVALAVRRLKIIDLVGGDQPFHDAATGVSLVANGEIYNHEELRRTLAAQGVEMRSRSDCETLLWLYLQRGLDFLNDVRGMFAFAIWDPRHQRLVLGRDRMGEKPLYIARNKHGFIFASELKALLASGLVDFRIEPTALYQYFHFNYVPEPLTMVSGVFKLPAAHLIVLEAETMSERLINYWRMENAPELLSDRPAEVIRAKLEEVALLVTRSDVPIGISLSGGLDSSSLAALVAKHSPQTAHAFSIGYPGEPWNDERRFARKTAARLGLAFHEAELDEDDVVEHFPETIERLDEPIADPATSCYRRIAQLARQHGVPVLIQGQGGDELFWGYPWVRRALTEARDKRAFLDGGIPPSLWRYFGGPGDFSAKRLAIWAKDGFGVLPALSARRRVVNGPARRIPSLMASPTSRAPTTSWNGR